MDAGIIMHTSHSNQVPELDIMGPVASPIPRIKDRYRFQCMLKYRGEAHISKIVGKSYSLFR